MALGSTYGSRKTNDPAGLDFGAALLLIKASVLGLSARMRRSSRLIGARRGEREHDQRDDGKSLGTMHGSFYVPATEPRLNG